MSISFYAEKWRIILENNEKIVLEKLANMGFVMKLHDDFCDIPSAIQETDYPLNIYICINNKPIFIKSFQDWNDIQMFVMSIV